MARRNEDVPATWEMKTYFSFMEEIKLRLSAAKSICDELEELYKSPHAFILAEQCYLQLRFVIELMALGSLAIHLNQANSKKLLKEWHAGKTFEALERINTDSFPKAVNFEDSSVVNFHFTENPSAQIDIEEIKTIYGTLGRKLHKGILKHIVEEKRPFHNIGDIKDWTYRIARLMDKHMILVKGKSEVMITDLSGGEDGSTLVMMGAASDQPPSPPK